MKSVYTKLAVVFVVSVATCGCQRVSRDGDLEAAVAQATPAADPETDVVAEIPVPDGDPESLFQFMLDIEQQELGGIATNAELDDESEARYVDALRRVSAARLKACDKILSSDIEPETMVSAIQMKLDALRTLSIVDAQRLGKQYEPFATELTRDSNPRVVNLARASLFQASVNEFLTDADADSAAVAAELEQLLSHDDLNEDVFVAARDALTWLLQHGHLQIATRGFKQLAASFHDHENAEVAEQANSLLAQTMQLELNQDIDRVLADEAGSIPNLLKALTAALDSTTTSEADRLGVGVRSAQTLEFGGRFDAARQTYAAVQQHFSDAADPQLLKDIQRTVDLANRRMDLIGKPLQIDGVLLDGEPFVWKNFRDEHVIVCFWTSWDTGWPDQVRQIRQVAEPYRDQGLKVVTINLDDDRNALERYLQSYPLSWPIVVDSDLNSLGFENQNAVRCGVEAVPFILLVDPQGQVADIHLFGDRLPQSLEKNLNGPLGDQSQRSILGSLETYFVALQSSDGSQESENEQRVGSAEEGSAEDAQASPTETAPEASSQEELEQQLRTLNPYAPPADASAIDLIEFIIEMQDKPRSIQSRPGFTDGIVQAADRILEMDAKQRWRTEALLAKFQYLHRDAALGNEQAERALRETIEQWKDDERPEVNSEIRFLQLEQRALKSEQMSPDELAKLLTDLREFFNAETLEAKHLRLASLTVRAVNQLDSAEDREKHFQSFGGLFGKSDDQQVAAYGRRIAGSDGAVPDLINSKLELKGVTTAGAVFNWEFYRERWVVVDFWATWCGPCRVAMPELRKLADQYKDRRLDVVGISLDEDLKALAEYLGEEELPWTILAGPEAIELAKTYGVRGIPQYFLVDPQGTVRFISHRIDEIAEQIAKELP